MKKILFNYILYFSCLIFICIVGISKVFAFDYTYNNVAEIRDYTEQLVSTNYGNAPFTNPRNSGYAFNEVLQVDYIVSNYTFNANTNYQLESHLSNQVFTNVNAYKVAGLNGETCMTSYSNSILNNNNWPRWAFQCPHQTNTITISIYNTGGSYLWSGTGIFNWDTALLKSSSEAMTSSDTNSIINNQNQNTQDIINNQNQNTQDIIDSNKVCNKIDKINIVLTNKYLASDGTIGTNTDFGVTDYISISDGSTLEQLTLQNSSSNAFMCFYNVNKSLISCLSSKTHGIGNITFPNNTSYVRFSIIVSENKPTFKICQNGNQALNDTLNDGDVGGATNEAGDFFSDFNTNTFGLTSIITAPLNLIQSLTSSTCSQLELPLPYLDNKKLILPCMSTIYSTYFGTFFTMYQTITYGIIAYWVCVRIFNMVKDFKNPEHDEIEVVDL